MSVWERNHGIVVAGAGYAGLHVAMRLATKLRDNPGVQLTLVDWHDFHQVMTELPRVAGGTRAADAVRIPVDDVVARRVRFLETQITGFDLAGHLAAGPTTSPSRPGSDPDSGSALPATVASACKSLSTCG
jgi:nucleoside-diphosphate-sugar epimerase